MTAPSMENSRRRTSLGAVFVGALLVALGGQQFRRAPVDEVFVGGTGAPPTKMTKVARHGIDKAMKDRINSVQKTGKLTDAMRLVAAAKVRKAQDGVTRSRPFSEELQSMIKGLVKKLKGSGLELELPMLRIPEKVNNVGILMVNSNRGLCGAYNSFVQKKTRARIEELNKQGIVPKLFLVGRKATNALNAKLAVVDLNYTEVFFSMPDSITSKESSEIGDSLRSWFLSGEVDKIEVVYAKFMNMLTNKPTIKTLLPLSPTGIESAEDETFTMTSEDGKLGVKKEKVPAAKAKNIESDVIFDQPPATILNSMLPLYLNSQILSILFDAQASELSSRMNAMKAATDNAEELVASLTMLFNKKRQAGITAEISEISAGALSLEGGDGAFGPRLGVTDNEDTVMEDLMEEIETGSIPDVPQAPEGPDKRVEVQKEFGAKE